MDNGIKGNAGLAYPTGIAISLWKRGLRIGYRAAMPGLERARIILLNGLVIIASFSVVGFSLAYAIIGYRYYYGPLYLVPVAALVLWLNSKGYFPSARKVYFIGSLFVMIYWCYEGRGNGNEFILIALATTATLIFEKKYTVIACNVICAVIFVGYRIYDASVPFIPDPVINYNIVPLIILLNTVGIISFQMAFFRDLAKHYDNKFTIKYNELQAAQEELKSSHEEIKTMNDRLHSLTGALEDMVKEKTSVLQTYIDAIDVNLYSCINDLEGNFVQVNDQLVKASGYSREALLGKHYTLLATPAHQRAHFEQRQQQLYAGGVWRGEVEHKDKNGNPYWFDCVVIPIKWDNGQNKCYLSIGLPITERKLHEQLKEKTFTVLESIAFKASHNIRGPIARIKGLANLIGMDRFETHEFKMVAQKFAECTEELSQATSELVNFVYNHQQTLSGSNPG